MTCDPQVEAFVRDVLIGSPVARALGIALDVIEVDRVVLRLPFATENVTLARIVHGGVIAALIDVAGASASFSGAASGALGATSTLAISYLAPADGVDLVAEARVVQRSRSQTVADVTVRDPGGRLIAKALSTNRVFPPR